MKHREYRMWGKSTHINLHECDLARISSPKAITKFVKDIIVEIKMVAHGPCHIERFGEGDLEGYSAMQFIETSAITIHCDEPGRRAFIDIFSCKDFDAQNAENFSKNYFKAGKSSATTLIR